jgi:cytoskeletal protein CcmA (bactofilin family)
MRERTGESNLSGFLGEGTVISGDLRFPEILRVEGKITGKITSEKELVVGESGEIEAEIEVGSLSVNGKVSGTLRVRERLTIHAHGQVRGELILEGPGLIIEEGGIFEGTIEMASERRRDLKEVRLGVLSES